MVMQRKISIVWNVVGAVFIAACFVALARHLRYLSTSSRPDRPRIVAELDSVVEHIPGVKASAVDVFDTKATYVSASVSIKVEHDFLSVDSAAANLARVGWSSSGKAHEVAARFCKGDLVTSISSQAADGTYGVQVNWGTADAVCLPSSKTKETKGDG